MTRDADMFEDFGVDSAPDAPDLHRRQVSELHRLRSPFLSARSLEHLLDGGTWGGRWSRNEELP